MNNLPARLRSIEKKVNLFPKRNEVYSIYEIEGKQYLKSYRAYGGNQPDFMEVYNPLIDYKKPEENDDVFRVFVSITLLGKKEDYEM